ncbi:Holliday junction resolvase RecU [Neobacillus sp. MM2021_6]|uniref:Holliday junction resolvase RecU n=1 Tax=Bacillaceae TaxID=186817 RepID=UPI001409EA3D|nr:MULTISPECIES: Holliday junction resolvase RecU [Bacillaceae]MBO0958190.1 Holliday junction resolvase RecU [Neobacillus sp. MM2021_6]NHC18526.1 Holliday junction resolvase RecU [Bacillus sp. MM2020_4]
MNVNYPNGKKYKPVKIENDLPIKKKKNGSYSNRGMTLEEDLNETNEYYRDRKIAVIHKKPTPVQIVQVDYPNRSAAVIKEAYFKLASTTDYNGVYNGKYIDFEAKETQNTTSFPLKNFHQHQVEHMEEVLNQGGICFVILRFTRFEQVYLLEAQHLLNYWKRMISGGRKSITKEEIEQHGHRIPLGFQPRIDYIKIIDALEKVRKEGIS